MKKIYIGIFGAVISAVSDVLLLYHPQLVSKYKNYEFLFEVDEIGNTMGWVLGMLGIPLLYLGYKGVKEIADEYSKTSLEKNDWVVVFLIALGCVVHSGYHFLPLFHILNPRVEQVEINSIKFLEVIFVSFYLMFCLIVTLQSLKVKNLLLYANRYFNPLFWMIFAAIVMAITPTYGGYLAVSAFNVSVGFYFVGILVNKKKVV
jgi:hypothetical protein